MQPDRRWSDADRELVAQAIRDDNPHEAWQATAPLVPADHWADAVLDALTAAGWRPPPAIQVHIEATTAPCGHCPYDPRPGRTLR